MPVKLQGGAIVWDKVNDGADQSGAEIAYCSLNERVDVVRYMWRGMMQGEGVGSMRQQGNKALNERRIHPTQKPVKLYEWLLQQYAQPGMEGFRHAPWKRQALRLRRTTTGLTCGVRDRRRLLASGHGTL